MSVRADLTAGGDVRCSACRAPMTPTIGWNRHVTPPRRLLWWTCDTDPEHITAALPLPDRMMVYAPGTREGQPPA